MQLADNLPEKKLLNMKHFILFALMLLAMLQACTSGSENPESVVKGADSIVFTDAGEQSTTYATYIKTLFGKDSLWLRGLGEGSTKEEIKNAMLPINPDEVSGDTLFYLIQLEKIDAVDIEFISKASKGLQQVNVFFYPKDKVAQQGMMQELGAYLDKRFGKNPSGKSNEWEFPEGKATMIGMDQAGVHDISLVFNTAKKSL
jgi:hypothetical protein